MKSNTGMRLRSWNCLFQLVAVIFVITVLLTSCAANKNIPYFKDIPDSTYDGPKNIPIANFSDPLIQPNDILQVSILTLDPKVNEALSEDNSSSFSVQPGTSASSSSQKTVEGFLVDKNGKIELPIIGKIKVAGLTTAQARDTIHQKVSVFYKTPVVNVRFTNFTVTVMGEVARPATYTVPNEKINIMEAIGMAGDLTIYGRRENVLLIRDSFGVKQFVRFNLNSSEVLNSPYFYLRQGDMVYVEPNKAKIASSDGVRNRNITLIASALTVLITLASRL